MNAWLLSCFLVSTTVLNGGLVVSATPSIVIDGIESGLMRPEGIAFSPDDQLIAVSDTDAYALIFYSYNESGEYEPVPSDVIASTQFLQYPHAVNFTSDGKYIATASRNNHTIVFFSRDSAEENLYSHDPSFILKGTLYKMNLPAGLSFTPDGSLLAVANRGGLHPVLIYSMTAPGVYGRRPIYWIEQDDLLSQQLAEAHDIAFSPDGQLLAIVHKRTFGSSQGGSGISLYEVAHGSKGKIQLNQVMALHSGDECLHSISFHPSGQYFAVTNEREYVWIFEKQGETCELIHKIPVEKPVYHHEGPKGVAFSSKGDKIAITTMVPSVLIYDLLETE